MQRLASVRSVVPTDTPAAPRPISTSHFDIVIDCGSGGTRPYPRGSPLPSKLPWTGPRTIAEALQSDNGRRAFAAAVEQLAEAEVAGGRPTPAILLGATAGLRYALEVTQQVTHAQIEELSSLLPTHCSLRVLSGLEEASCELRACRRYHADPSCAIISMGGRSMQIGREASLHSLPFAAHWGRGVLRDAAPDADWAALVASVGTSYERMCAEAQAAKHIVHIEGSVVGIVDVVDMARRVGIAERTLTVAELCKAMDVEVRKHSQQRGAESHLGQVLAFRAVVRQLLAPTCTVSFADFKVNWTEGFFLQQQETESVGGIGASHLESQEAPPPSPAAAPPPAPPPPALPAAATVVASASVTRHELKVLTLNCWFDDYEQDTRAEALRRLIIDSAADIVMLQEVVPKLVRFLAAQPDIAERYVLSTAAADADQPTSVGGCDPYGVLMLVLRELGAPPTFVVSELPSRMDRTMLTARVQLNGEVFTAATVHLESSSSDPSAAESGSTRQKQLVVATAALDDAAGRQAAGSTVLAGDFNFCSRREWSDAYTTASCGTHGRRPLENDVLKSPEILPGFRDVWPDLRPDELGFTYDTVRNEMLHNWHCYEQMRFDRMMFRGSTAAAATAGDAATTAGWRPRDIELVGTEPLPSRDERLVVREPPTIEQALAMDPEELSLGQNPLFLSDHFGLILRLEWTE